MTAMANGMVENAYDGILMVDLYGMGPGSEHPSDVAKTNKKLSHFYLHHFTSSGH